MATTYRIVCTKTADIHLPSHHSHITHVGTGDDTGFSKLWTEGQVFMAMMMGDKFYTKSKSTGVTAEVHKMKCPTCGHDVLRSAPDSVRDNNLDNLPACT